jgi:hypothetical protein
LLDIISSITLSVSGLPVWTDDNIEVESDFEIVSATVDVIEIRNVSDRALTTRGLYLTNSSANLRLWRMPAMNLQPGEVVRIVLNDETPAMKRTRAGFTVIRGQTVRLSDVHRNVLSYLEVTEVTEVA